MFKIDADGGSVPFRDCSINYLFGDILLIATYSVTGFYMIVYRSKLRLIGHHIYGSMSWFLWLEVIVSIANLS